MVEDGDGNQSRFKSYSLDSGLIAQTSFRLYNTLYLSGGEVPIPFAAGLVILFTQIDWCSFITDATLLLAIFFSLWLKLGMVFQGKITNLHVLALFPPVKLDNSGRTLI